METHVKALKKDAKISKINRTHILRPYSLNQNSHTASNPIGVNDDWTVKFETNGTDVIYKIDSGAQVNVMPESIYETLKQKSELKPTKVKLTAYNGSQIPVIGQR